MKRIVIWLVLQSVFVLCLALASFLIAKKSADRVAFEFEVALSPLESRLILFGDDPWTPCWVFRWEYTNLITGATFDVYVSFTGKVLMQH